MKMMNNANISPEERDRIFQEMVEAVFLFIHEHYGDFASIIDGYGLNYTQYVALVTVFMHGTLTQGDLARMMFLNPSTISRMVYALEKHGWLRSERDERDRRKVMVSLTPSGRRRMEGMMRKQASVVARQVESLPEDKREYVHRAAEYVNQALRYMISGGGKEEGKEPR